MEIIVYKVERTQKARNNVRSIFNYIVKKDSLERANYVIDGIDETINNAAILPTKHRVEPTLNNPNIRFTVKWNYKIVFQINSDNILVLRVFHTAQSPKKLHK